MEYLLLIIIIRNHLQGTSNFRLFMHPFHTVVDLYFPNHQFMNTLSCENFLKSVIDAKHHPIENEYEIYLEI